MALERASRSDLDGKVIDVHAHAGVSLKAYALMEYPYAQTVEGLYYRQLAGGVDVNVVFPFSAHLHFDPVRLMQGEMVPADRPFSCAPYGVENRLMMRELFDYCPEIAGRFLPFVCIDPGRAVREQLAGLETLETSFPIYGIKVDPVGCQSHVAELLRTGERFLDFARERDIPMLFHVTTMPGEEYSQAADVFRIVERRPELRFCLAHCLLFHREFLERAHALDNVWVDTAAMKIQVEMMRRERERSVPASQLIDADYDDHTDVMRTLCERYPDTMIWGTDSPAYTYICRRKQAEGAFYEFSLKGTYEDEIAALRALPGELQAKVSNRNTLDFLFGSRGC